MVARIKLVGILKDQKLYEWTLINYRTACIIVSYKIAYEYHLCIPCPIPGKPPVFLDKPA